MKLHSYTFILIVAAVFAASLFFKGASQRDRRMLASSSSVQPPSYKSSPSKRKELRRHRFGKDNPKSFAEADTIETVTAFLDRDPRLIKSDEAFEKVFRAITYQQTDLLELLLKRGVPINRGWSKSGGYNPGTTPLMLAAGIKDSLAMVKSLVRMGAEVNAADSRGETAYYVAVSLNRAETADFLKRSGARIEATHRPKIKEENGSRRPRPLLEARGADQVKAYLDSNPDLIKSEEAFTKLFFAMVASDDASAILLIERGVEINKPSEEGVFPLMYACKTKLLSVVEALVKKGADVNAVDSRGQSVLVWAVGSGDEKIIAFLKAKGAH